jgi:hypothetical protein
MPQDPNIYVFTMLDLATILHVYVLEYSHRLLARMPVIILRQQSRG